MEKCDESEVKDTFLKLTILANRWHPTNSILRYAWRFPVVELSHHIMTRCKSVKCTLDLCSQMKIFRHEVKLAAEWISGVILHFISLNDSNLPLVECVCMFVYLYTSTVKTSAVGNDVKDIN